MTERSLWHPVAAQAEWQGRPLPVRLLGRELVLWCDAEGRAAVFDDRCPHRGSKLSLGRVEGNELHCAYHGWQFDAASRCVHIPATPAFVPPPSHGACAHDVRLSHGLWWVRLKAEAGGAGVDAAAAGGPPALAGLPPREVVCGPFDVATSAPRAVENFLDTAHFAFVHDGWLGERGRADVPDFSIGHTADGRPLVEHYRTWQPRASASAAHDAGAWVDYRYEVLAPYAALLNKRSDGVGTDEAYALWVCPQDEERCRVWFTLFTSDLHRPAGELQAFQQTIFLQDQGVLESQRPKRLPLHGGEVHSAADRLSMAYRRYLLAAGVAFGVV